MTVPQQHLRAAADAPGGLGELVQAWRERALLTQDQLAERTGLHVRTIRRLERGRGRPHSSSLRRIAAALELAAPDRALLVERIGRVPAPAPRDAGGPPRHLPAAPPLYTGRAADVADLERVGDRPGPTVITVDGMAGVGKTALATRVAHGWSRRCPDGQLFLDLQGSRSGAHPVDPRDALGRLLGAIGVPGGRIPDELEDRAALYRSCLADRAVLVLLDDAASEAQVVPLLPGTGGSLVMITSRRRLTGLDVTYAHSLDVLPAGDAVDLLLRSSGRGGSPAEQRDQLAETAELCGFLPLAVRIAAARLRSRPSWSPAHLNERLRRPGHRLSELEAGGRSVAAALDASYLRLGREARRCYRMLALHPGVDFDGAAAAALTGRFPAQVEPLLDQLHDIHLLQEPVPGRYRFHDLTRAHALRAARSEEPEPEPDRRGPRSRPGGAGRASSPPRGGGARPAGSSLRAVRTEHPTIALG